MLHAALLLSSAQGAADWFSNNREIGMEPTLPQFSRPALRGRKLMGGCQVAVNAISGSGSVLTNPDQLVISADLTGPVADRVGAVAAELKALAEGGVAGSKYQQSFHQQSNWDNKLQMSVKGDWKAIATITVPIRADAWKADSSMVTGLINKILSLDTKHDGTKSDDSKNDGGYRRLAGKTSWFDETKNDGYNLHTYGQPIDNGYAAPVTHTGAVHVSVASTYFQVSAKLRAETEKTALGLAVTDAVANIKQSAMPWLALQPEQLKTFGPGSLKNVQISNTGNSGIVPRPMAFMRSNAPDAGASGDDIGTDSLSYVAPAKQSISQRVTVSACVI